jgi:alkylation response protein AidB-like acyl-CoA dehydrogenase
MALEYRPPLDEVAFLLGPWLQAEQDWKRIPRFAELDGETADAVLAEAGRFCAEVLAPINASGDAQGCRIEDGRVKTPAGFPQAYQRYVADGWASLARDLDLGGQGLPELLEVAFTEMQVAANHGWAMYPGLLAGAVACLQAHADDALKARYLPQLVSGQWLPTMCLTEPQAGSDLALLRTRAEPAADGSYRISGNKIFISGGSQDLTDNIVHLVLARLPDAPAGTRGISLFLVPDVLEDGSRNAVHCDGIEHKMGINGSATTSLRFEQAIGWRVGEPHRGLPSMFVMMNAARLHAAMQGVGHADRAFQLASDYAAQRRQMRAEPRQDPSQAADLIAAHPPIRHLLKTLRGWSEGMRAAGFWLGHQIDLAEHATDPGQRQRAQALVELLTPVAKAYFTEYGHVLADRALQVFGGYGYVREYGIEQVVRDSRIAMVYEGTNEIQALDLLQRKLLADKGARLAVFAAACNELAGQARSLGLQAQASVVERMLRRHARALERTSAAAAGDPERVARVADAFLRLTGHLLLAYAWLRTAVVCAGADGEPARQRRECADWMLGELRLEFNVQLARVNAGNG